MNNQISDLELDLASGGDFSFQIFGYQVDYVIKTTAVPGPHGELAVLHTRTITIGPAPK